MQQETPCLIDTGHVCHEHPLKHYKKDTSIICLRQKCDHQVDAYTTSRYCVHEVQHTVHYIFVYLLQPNATQVYAMTNTVMQDITAICDHLR